MKLFKTLFYHYIVGVLLSTSITLLTIFFDHFANGYVILPDFFSLVLVCLLSGVGFGFTHYVSLMVYKSYKQ